MSTIYTTSGDDLTSIANAIRTKGGTSASLSYPTDFITAINNISGGGGGGLPVVTGSFTTINATGVQTITIPYSGNGYPLMIMIVAKGGYELAEPFNTTVLKRKAATMVLTKANPDLPPTYSTGPANMAVVYDFYKTSATTTGVAGNYSLCYTSNAPSGGLSGVYCIRIPSANTFNIYVSIADNSYGFYPDQEYDYWVMYSE